MLGLPTQNEQQTLHEKSSYPSWQEMSTMVSHTVRVKNQSLIQVKGTVPGKLKNALSEHKSKWGERR